MRTASATQLPPDIDPKPEDQYKRLLMAHLGSKKRYPRRAMSGRIEGTVVLEFRIGAMGELVSRQIKTSSGFPILDQAALALLDRAVPFPAPPQASGKRAYTVPVGYRLSAN